MLHEPRVETRRVPALRVVSRETEPIETTGGTISTHVIETLPDLVTLEREWDDLFSKSGSAAPPLRWGWVREWWRYFGTPDRRLSILTVRRGAELLGVLPLYKEAHGSKRADLFTVSLSGKASDSFYPEYIDVLSAPGTDAIVSGAIVKFVTDGGFGAVRRIHLGLCRTGGLLERSIAPALKRPWGDLSTTVLRAPVADLTGGFEEYLGRLSTNARQQMRRLLRSIDGLHDLRFEIAATKEAADSFLLELIELHQAKWRAEGEPGAFSTPERIAFHRAIVARLFNDVALARLVYQGRTVTALYGFIVKKKFDFYQSGNSTVEIPLKRPGILAHLLTMKALIEQGLDTYDFLEGEAPYKLQLRTATHELSDISIYEPSPLNLVRRARRDLGTLLRRFPR